MNKFNEIRQDLFCDFCGKQCKSLNSLSNHQRMCKKNDNRILHNKLLTPKVCDVCGKIFYNSSSLTYHKLTCGKNLTANIVVVNLLILEH